MSKYFLLIGLFALLSAVGTSAASTDNCTTIDNCDDCEGASCHWIQCLAASPSCQGSGPEEMCNEVPCDDPATTVPTTTDVPTTVPTTEPVTTDAPTTVPPTTDPPTTLPPTTVPPTDPPTTDPPTSQPPTTLPPTTETPTDPPTTDTPTTVSPTTTEAPSPTPSGRHFDGASFFGGMVLAIAIIAVGFAAWRFYKSRNGRSYHTL